MLTGKQFGYPMQRFMEACLLILLCENNEDCHGYCLADKLKSFGFTNEELNISTLYRTLRTMEQAAWVRSHWESGGQGPQRRVYGITDEGRGALNEWAAVMRNSRERIGNMLEAYEKIASSQ